MAILLVVLGHAITTAARVNEPGPGLAQVGPGLWVPEALTADPLLTILYSFHMPLFAFVSGLVLYKAVPDRFVVQLKKRSLGLLVPYFAWFTITYGLAAAAGRAPFAGFFAELARVTVFPVNHYSLWYLHALFISALLISAIAQLPKASEWLFPASAVASVAIMSLPGMRDLQILGIGNVLFIYPYVVAGYLATPQRELLDRRRWSFVSAGAVGFVVLSVLAVFAEQTTLTAIPLAGGVLRALAVWAATATAAVGVYALYRALRGWLLSSQAFVGKRSLGIYAMHSFVQIGLVEVFGLRLLPALFFISVAISLGATLVIERIPVLRTILLGLRSRRSADRPATKTLGTEGIS